MINQSKLSRRQLMTGAGAALALGLPWSYANAAAKPVIQVYKSPTCGCCEMWVEHLAAHGFEVKAEDVADLDTIKQMASIPDHLLACHTALVEGYAIEGHVPAVAIQKLLVDRPAIRGLAVPGMPAGSPGMPSPDPERYDVITFGDSQDQIFMSFVETNPV